MRIVYWVKGGRGVSCLRRSLESGREVCMLLLQPQPDTAWYREAAELAAAAAIPMLDVDDPGDPSLPERLGGLGADVFVLAGYGRILPPEITAIPKRMCVNLHGGALPRCRGSSPMNWALINGEEEHGISILKVDAGVDTGDVLMQRSFPIDVNDTIRDLHRRADENFPDMLEAVLDGLARGTLTPKPQDEAQAGYYPLRFPEDGLVLFDRLSAKQVHDRIRALTRPYPCAYTYHKGRKVLLLSSRLKQKRFYGEPGRIYRVREGRVLVCARDLCLWIIEAVFEDNGRPLADVVQRYDRLASVAQAVERILAKP